MKHYALLILVLLTTLLGINAWSDVIFQPALAPMTTQKALELISKVKSTIIDAKYPDLTPIQFGIPWAYAVGNHCEQRSFISYLIMATKSSDTTSPILNAPLSENIVNQILKKPEVSAAHISLRAPMKLEQKISFTKNLIRPYNLVWSNHEALVINVDKTLMVVDLTASDKPLKVSDWIKFYYPGSCKNVSADDYNKILIYDTCLHNGWISGNAPRNCNKEEAETKGNVCVYQFTDNFGFNPDAENNSWGSLNYYLNEAVISFISDIDSIKADISPIKIDIIKDISRLTSTVNPIMPYRTSWNYEQ